VSTYCQCPALGIAWSQVEPKSLKNSAAQLKEVAKIARFERPLFFICFYCSLDCSKSTLDRDKLSGMCHSSGENFLDASGCQSVSARHCGPPVGTSPELHRIVVGPILDCFETRPLRSHPSPQRPLRYYRFTFVWLAATAVACWAQGFGNLTTLGRLGIHVEWLPAHSWVWWLLASLVVVAIILHLVLPVVQVSIKYRDRPFLEPKQLESPRFFLPSSTVERRWFVALSINAGFCEKLLFRGFLLRYLHTWPLHLASLWTVLAAGIIFGTHHLYQGANGVVSASIGALIFTAMLIVTGSLWAGTLYPAAADIGVLLYWRQSRLLVDPFRISTGLHRNAQQNRYRPLANQK
jgi:uncharacterized protein